MKHLQIKAAIKREDTLQKIKICVSDENTDQHMETKLRRGLDHMAI